MKNKMSKEEYQEYVKDVTPNSPILKNCINAFIFGGIICVIGQLILNMFKSFGLSDDAAASATSITLIFIGTFLTGFNVYGKLAKIAGAGTIVPITGFANAVAAPAIEAKPEGLVLGVGAKIFTVAGPVIVFGTIASAIAGIIYYIMLAL